MGGGGRERERGWGGAYPENSHVVFCHHIKHSCEPFTSLHPDFYEQSGQGSAAIAGRSIGLLPVAATDTEAVVIMSGR